MTRARWFSAVVVVVVLLLALSVTLLAQATPMIEVQDQTVMNNTVTIARVVAAEPGWVAIHMEKDGKPGPVIGRAPVPAGESTNVMVTIDVAKATPRLFAMLHVDKGEMGKYEFPGPDAPVKVGDKVVVVPFNVTLPALPTTGGNTLPLTWLVVATGLALVGLGVGLRRVLA